MNPFEPNPSALSAHRKLAAVLTCRPYTLLQAKADVWEPGETPEPRPSSGPPRVPGEPRPASMRSRVMGALTDRPQTVTQIVAHLRADSAAVRMAASALVQSGHAQNIARGGAIGQYVRRIAAKRKPGPVTQRGVFAV